MDTVLILGGAGFIGINLAKELNCSGYQVVIFDKQNANWQKVASEIPHSIQIHGDFSNTDDIRLIFKNHKIDCVIHLISTILPGNMIDTLVQDVNDNLTQTLQLMNILIEAGIDRLVFFSSGGTVYGCSAQEYFYEDDPTNPINSYGWMKLTIEKAIQLYAYQKRLKYLILRPSNPYGIHQNIFGKQGLIAVAMGNAARDEEMIVWGNGSVIRDYIYIADLCKATSELIKNNCWNTIVNIGSGRGASVKQILAMIEKVSEKSMRIKYVEARKQDAPISVLNINRLKSLIQFGDGTSLEVGMKLMWDWIQRDYL